MFYVYEHWRLDRDECFYVGKGKGKRAYELKNRNRHHKAIVAKLSRIGSAFEVRIVSSGLTEDEAFNLERDRIAFWRGKNVDLANLTDGGDGIWGFKHSEETKNKMKESALKANTDEVRQKKSAARKGIVFSDEHKKKISQSLIGQKRAAKKRKPEFGQKMSKLLKGRKLTDAQIEQRRQSMLAVWKRRKENA